MWGLGHENFNEKINFNDYDVVLNLENYDNQGWVPNLSQFKGVYKILWSIDAHCRGVECYNQTFAQGKYNLLLHSTRDYAVGKDRVWLPNCYDNTLIYPMNIDKKYNIGFCGNYMNRKDSIDLIEQNYGIKKDIFVIGKDMVTAINSYKIHFNKNILNDINYRSFETIGCGTLLIRNKNYQYDLLGFKDEENCLLYDNNVELLSKIGYIINNEEKIKNISLNGLNLSNKHTYDARIGKLVNFIKEKI